MAVGISVNRAASARSCFNIYKRTSSRMMARTQESGPNDLNRGRFAENSSSMLSLLSDDQPHVTSQTTLNLDQKCPFNISIVD